MEEFLETEHFVVQTACAVDKIDRKPNDHKMPTTRQKSSHFHLQYTIIFGFIHKIAKKLEHSHWCQLSQFPLENIEVARKKQKKWTQLVNFIVKT